MDEGGEILKPVNTTPDNLSEDIPEVLNPEQHPQISDNQPMIYPDDVNDQIAQQIHTLEREMKQEPIVEDNASTKKEKTFKIGKMLGLGALFTLLLALWNGLKGMFGGKNQNPYGQ